MSASRSRWCSPTINTSRKTPPTWSRSISSRWTPIIAATDEPGVYEGNLTTEPDVIRKGYGDVEAAFAKAHAVVELDLAIGRHSGVPLETRGAIARYDEARDVLEMHGAAKVPHWNRDTLARMLGRAPESVQLYEGHVGGGFGIRGEIYPEDVLVCAAALHFKQADQMDRGPARAPDRRQPFAPAAAPHQGRHRQRRSHPRHRRRIFPRQWRLYAHARRDRARPRGRHAAGALSRAGLSRHRPYPPHQQDALRHLSRAGALRIDLRARAAAGRHRGESRRRPGRDPPPQPDRQERHALCARARYARHAHRL